MAVVRLSPLGDGGQKGSVPGLGGGCSYVCIAVKATE